MFVSEGVFESDSLGGRYYLTEEDLKTVTSLWGSEVVQGRGGKKYIRIDIPLCCYPDDLFFARTVCLKLGPYDEEKGFRALKYSVLSVDKDKKEKFPRKRTRSRKGIKARK